MTLEWRKVAAEARVCERTARRWAKGLPVSGNVDARMADAAARLGMGAPPRAAAPAAPDAHGRGGGSGEPEQGHHGAPSASEGPGR